jgi:uncharacterized membrane protein YdbT with pleckstrin-like domain
MRAVAFPTKLLQDDEELVLDLKPHWWYLAPAGAILAVAIVLGVLSLSVDTSAVRALAGIMVLAALVHFGVVYVRWATTNFVVTNERVVSRSGLVSRRGSQIPLEKINSVDFHQRLFERILGAGDLVIESGSEAGIDTFSDVRKPLAVQQEINRQIDVHEKTRWAGRVPAASPGISIPEQLEKLAELRDRGVLTPAEFEAKKTQLLDRL